MSTRNTEVIYVPLPGWRDLHLTARRHLEILVALVFGSSALLWREVIAQNFANGIWDLSAFYAAAFDWSSIQGAFLFGVYAFFLSKSEPFLKAVASSPFFPALRRYVVRTLYLSMALTVLTLPMLVSPANIKTNLGFAVFLALSTLLVFTFFSFLKVVRVFGKIERSNS